MSEPLKWTEETMRTINLLTPDIKGKSFDPDWFMLRQRFEQMELRVRYAENKLAQIILATK